MHLLMHLIVRLLGVVVLCLATAVVWITFDSHRSMDASVAASAARVGQHLEALYWQRLLWRGGMRRNTLLPLPEWQSLSTQAIMSPGVCVRFAPPGNESKTLCSQVEAVGESPPTWFVDAYTLLLGAHHPVRRPLTIRDRDAGELTVTAQPEAALRLAWQRISTVLGIALAMAAGIAVLAALMISYSLLPARAIIHGLHQLQQGNLACRLPGFRTAEFDHIAQALNQLAENLATNKAMRQALMTRLFQVQEEERRAIARDLHDEFGQCLTATAALAAIIEHRAGGARKDIADDAAKIAQVQRRMMQSLRGTLKRLRSQNIEEIGLEASLRQLVSEHNDQAGAATVFRLELAGQLTNLPAQIATDIYRIAQECLTNSVRHASPSQVHLHVERLLAESDAVFLTVVDDGAGDASRIEKDPGFGILGIRERLEPYGGSFTVGQVGKGVRVAAIIPIESGLTPA
jgi:two-component system, NarL family, sensor histidine kinase UhpB